MFFIYKGNMKNNFNEHAVGSAYSLGNINAPVKIVMLHGNGSCANLMCNAGEILSKKIPAAEIIIPNGSYVISEEILSEDLDLHPDGLDHTPFTWYADDASICNDPLDDRLANLKNNPDNRIYLLGFSIGGFRAAEEFFKAPDNYKGAVLHSSGLLNVPSMQRHSSADKTPRLLTQMGLEDPYLRSKFALAMVPRHFFNQWKVNRAGIGAKSVFHSGLGHEMNEKSLSRSAQHILDLEAQ